MISSPRERTSIWESNKDRFLQPLLACCEAKITEKEFKSILSEIVKIDGELMNLNEIIKKTFLEKENIKFLFELFLDNCKEYEGKEKKEPSLLRKANRILLLILHLEEIGNKDKSCLVQLVMDNFETILEILQGKESLGKTVMVGGLERKRLGLSRVEILRLIHHCLIINHKNFNLMVSMSKFKEVLEELIGHYAGNDKFIIIVYDVLELILKTNHKPLINSVLGNGGIEGIVTLISQEKKKNNFMLLKIMRLIDINFDLKCRESINKPLENKIKKKEDIKKKDVKEIEETVNEKILFLQLLEKSETFSILQIKIYSELKKCIKTYYDLEGDLNDRDNTRMSGSSLFSNNMMDEMELDQNNMSNSLDSEENRELENIMKDDSNDNDFERISYGGIVRRRKISEDNIKVDPGRGRGGFANDYM